MAENVAAFEYKTQEEVLTVIRYLTHVLSVAGMQMINLLSPFIKPIDAPAEVTSEPQMLPDMSLESPERGKTICYAISLSLPTPCCRSYRLRGGFRRGWNSSHTENIPEGLVWALGRVCGCLFFPISNTHRLILLVNVSSGFRERRVRSVTKSLPDAAKLQYLGRDFRSPFSL
jgi:hypothetical protein